MAWVEVTGDTDPLRRWLGDAEVHVRIERGAPAVRAVGISLDGSEVEIRP